MVIIANGCEINSLLCKRHGIISWSTKRNMIQVTMLLFIGVIKCKKDENPFTRIVDIGIRSYNAWE